MRVDWDLVRTILVEIADFAPYESVLSKYLDFDEAAVDEHIQLLAEGGIIDAKKACRLDREWWWSCRMKWEGYQLLADMGTDEQWKKLKRVAEDRGVDLSLETIRAVAAEAKREIAKEVMSNDHARD